ncbi:MAG: hypothetical protein JWQ19_591 [Subtercola sp.]|nr:hypothetical protein [Subtercola sp.]
MHASEAVDRTLLVPSSDDLFVWREVVFPRPLDEAAAVESVRHLADDPGQSPLLLEVRRSSDHTQYLIGCDVRSLHRKARALGAVLVALSPERKPVLIAAALRLSSARRAFAGDDLSLSVASILAALAQAHRDEVIAIQLVLGRHHASRPIPSTTAAPQGVVQILSGTPPRTLDHEERQALARKFEQPTFRADVRIGVAAKKPERQRALILSAFAGLRRLEQPGVRFGSAPMSPRHFNRGHLPWRFPSLLSIREVAGLLALPVGNGELPGMPPLHPKQLASKHPHSQDEVGDDLVVGELTAPGMSGQITLSASAVLRGTHLMGPPGVGKSDLAATLAIEWINQGNAAVILEPKTDLSDAVTSRVDAANRVRLVRLNLLDDRVIGFNPLKSDGQSDELIADRLLTIFANVFSESVGIGVRTRDVLHAAIMTVLKHESPTLVMLPIILSDQKFRRSLVAEVQDDFTLASFWAWYEDQSDLARQQIVGPILSRLRQVLLRRTLRNSLGQSDPKFDVREVFGPEKKVLVVPLPEAQLGKTGAALYGSLVIDAVWAAIKARASTPQRDRHPVMIIVDEFSSYMRSADDFREAMAISRGYGAGFVLINQLLSQLPTDLRSATLGNLRSRVYFQLSAEDAHAVARFIPELEPVDFTSLPIFNIYASTLDDGVSQPFVSGRTLPLSKPLISPERVSRMSRERYGRPVADIEAEFNALTGFGESHQSTTEEFGRKRRKSNDQ